MTEVHLENTESLEPTGLEASVEAKLDDAQKKREGTEQVAAQTEAALRPESPKAAERFRSGVDNLSGIKIQGNMVDVAIGDGRVRLDTAEKSLQVQMDTFLGDLEARTKVVEGGTENAIASKLNMGPVGLQGEAVQDVEGTLSYKGEVELPEGIRLWVEQNKDGIVAGAQYEWKNDALGQGTFTLKRNETGQLIIEGTLKTPDGTKIKVTSTDGTTAEIKVARDFSVGGGRLSVNAALGVQNLDHGVTNARMGALGGEVSYTVRF